MGQRQGWVNRPSMLSREREAGLAVLNGLESVRRPSDNRVMMTVGWIGWEYSRSWENKAFLGAAELFLQSGSGSEIIFPSCFLLVQCFPWCFPQLLADTISSFYTWLLRHPSSNLYLDVWLHLRQLVELTVSTAAFIHSTRLWVWAKTQGVLSCVFFVVAWLFVFFSVGVWERNRTDGRLAAR